MGASGEVVLVIGHGSRDARANAQFEAVVGELRARVAAGVVVERAFIELCAPSLDEGFDAAVAAAGEGGTVSVAPLLLGDAGHMKRDVAGMLARGRARHPAVTTRCGAPLGDHALVRALLCERAREALSGADPSRATLVFATRGSTDEGALAAARELALRVGEEVGVARTEVAFVAVAEPGVAEVLAACGARGDEAIVVLPHLLTDGQLSDKLRTQWVPEAVARHGARFVLARVMAPDARLPEVLLARLAEAPRE